MHPNVHSTTVYNRQDMVTTQVCRNRLKKWYTQTHIHEISFSHKKNEILTFAATWMDLEKIILSNVRQAEKDKYCTVTLTCYMNLKEWVYIEKKNDSDIENKLTVTKVENECGRDKLGGEE